MERKTPINNFECNISAFPGLEVESSPGPRPGHSTTLITHRLCPGSDLPRDCVLSFAGFPILSQRHSIPFAVCHLALQLTPVYCRLPLSFWSPDLVCLFVSCSGHALLPVPPPKNHPEKSRPLERLTWHSIEDKLVSMKWKAGQGLHLDPGTIRGL